MKTIIVAIRSKCEDRGCSHRVEGVAVVPGLLLHRPLWCLHKHDKDSGSYALTHIDSGRCVTQFETSDFARAVHAAERIGRLTDWAQAGDAIKAAGIGDAVRRIASEAS